MKRALLPSLLVLAACQSAVDLQPGRPYQCDPLGGDAAAECPAGWRCGPPTLQGASCFDPEETTPGRQCRTREDCPGGAWACVRRPDLALSALFDGACYSLAEGAEHVCWRDADCGPWRCNLAEHRCVLERAEPEQRPGLEVSVTRISPVVRGRARQVAVARLSEDSRSVAWLGDDALLIYADGLSNGANGAVARRIELEGAQVKALAMRPDGVVVQRFDGGLRYERFDGGLDAPFGFTGSMRASLNDVTLIDGRGAQLLFRDQNGTPFLPDGGWLTTEPLRDLVRGLNTFEDFFALHADGHLLVGPPLEPQRLPDGFPQGPCGDGGVPSWHPTRLALELRAPTGNRSAYLFASRDGGEATHVVGIGNGAGTCTPPSTTPPCRLCPNGEPPLATMPIEGVASGRGQLWLTCPTDAGPRGLALILQRDRCSDRWETPPGDDALAHVSVGDVTSSHVTGGAADDSQVYLPTTQSNQGLSSSDPVVRRLMLDRVPELLVRVDAGTLRGLFSSTRERFYQDVPGFGLVGQARAFGTDERTVAFGFSTPELVLTDRRVLDTRRVDFNRESPRELATLGDLSNILSGPYALDLASTSDAGILVVTAGDRMLAAEVSRQIAAEVPITPAILATHLVPVPGLAISSFTLAASGIASSGGIGSATRGELIGFALAGIQLVQFDVIGRELTNPVGLSLEGLEGAPVEVFSEGEGAERRARLGTRSGQIYTLPTRAAVGAFLPAQSQPARDFGQLCGHRFTLTTDGLWQLQGKPGPLPGAEWVKQALPPEVGTLDGARLFEGRGELFLVLANGSSYDLVPAAGRCP